MLGIHPDTIEVRHTTSEISWMIRPARIGASYSSLSSRGRHHVASFFVISVLPGILECNDPFVRVWIDHDYLGSVGMLSFDLRAAFDVTDLTSVPPVGMATRCLSSWCSSTRTVDSSSSSFCSTSSGSFLATSTASFASWCVQPLPIIEMVDDARRYQIKLEGLAGLLDLRRIVVSLCSTATTLFHSGDERRLCFLLTLQNADFSIFDVSLT